MLFCGFYVKIYPVECGTLRKPERRMRQDIHGLFTISFVEQYLIVRISCRYCKLCLTAEVCLFFERFIVNTYAALKGEDCNDASRAKTCVTR